MSKKTDEQLERDAFHAGEALANPMVKEILSELEMESLKQLGTVDAFNAAEVAMAQADVKAVRKFYTRLVNKVQAFANANRARETKQPSPMGENT